MVGLYVFFVCSVLFSLIVPGLKPQGFVCS